MIAINVVNYSLYTVILLSTSILLGLFCSQKKWVAVAITGGLLIRLVVATILDSGLKYYFVLDSLRYERNAWLLAQSWMTPDLFDAFSATSHSARFNFYEVFLSWIFGLFGYDPLLASFVNSILATLAIAFIYRIQADFCSEKQMPGQPLSPSLITATILVLYPSFVIWSATNVRDPLYFLACVAFFYFFFVLFSRKFAAKVPLRLLSLVLAALCFGIILGLRGYVNALFIFAIGIGLCMYFASLYVRLTPILLSFGFFAVTFSLGSELIIPDQASKILSTLEEVRLSFANLKLADSVAKSSFGLDHTFNSTIDLFTFLPVSLGHYFLGPFPWEIGSWVQGLSLIEAVGVYCLLYPTWIGMRRCYERARFETLVILSFVATFALVQGLVISNMGTIFRHRTVGFLFLAIFAGEGVYELGKKNYPAFFKA